MAAFLELGVIFWPGTQQNKIKREHVHTYNCLNFKAGVKIAVQQSKFWLAPTNFTGNQFVSRGSVIFFAVCGREPATGHNSTTNYIFKQT